MDTRSSGSRRNLDYLLIRRTLKEWGRIALQRDGGCFPLRRYSRRFSHPDNLVVNTMNGGGQMLVVDRGGSVALDDGCTIGKWVGIRIAHRGLC